MFRKYFQWIKAEPASNCEQIKTCSHPFCAQEGKFRAPKSRRHIALGLNEWHWFCLAHVREYNGRWDYYANMTGKEIEADRLADATGRRPAWPLGVAGTFRQNNINQGAQKPQQEKKRSERVGGQKYFFYRPETFEDPFGLFNDCDSPFSSKTRFSPESPETEAMKVLGLSFPLRSNEIQKRYRELVKKYHPDANSGSLQAEEAIKKINEAYSILKKMVSGQTRGL